MGFSLAKGIFGTFMGIYNAVQMEKLRRDLNGVIETQNRVMEVVEDHQQQINDLNHEMAELKLRFRLFDAINMPLIQAQLNDGLEMIKANLEQATHAIQQAHHHRLSIDYFDPETLKYVYDTVTFQAAESKYLLLTRFPSDLFQLELSYLFDGINVVLFLHIPMVPQDSLLTLYRLRPFPIPFSPTMALLPKPTSSLLALSSSVPRAMTHIDHADLIDCHSVNQVYLCERHGVLKSHIKSSCLGALFEQDIETAQQVCDLELVPYEEAVLQLKNNWFLIYSPTMYTSYIQCFNSSSSAKAIKVRVNQIYVDPSCKMTLTNHTLTSDLSMKLDAEITYFQWELADLAAFGVNEDDIREALAVHTTAGERNLFLADVIQHKHFSSAFPKWKWVIATLIITGIILFVIFIIMSLGTHRVVSFRRRMRKIRDTVEQISQIPGARVLSRQHLRLPSQEPGSAPPMYPGLPNNDPDDSYELMALNPQTASQSLRSLSRISRAVSRLTDQINSRTSLRSSHRSASAPASHRASKISFFQPPSPYHLDAQDFQDDNDDDDDHFSTRSHTERSVGHSILAPTPSLRTELLLRSSSSRRQPAMFKKPKQTFSVINQRLFP